MKFTKTDGKRHVAVTELMAFNHPIAYEINKDGQFAAYYKTIHSRSLIGEAKSLKGAAAICEKHFKKIGGVK